MSQHTTEKVALFTPLLVGFVWFTSLVVSGKEQVTEAQLAPDRLNVLVTGLFIFIIVYGGFLFLLYKKHSVKHHKRHHRG